MLLLIFRQEQAPALHSALFLTYFLRRCHSLLLGRRRGRGLRRYVGTGEIPLLGEMSIGQKGNGEDVTPTVRFRFAKRVLRSRVCQYRTDILF